MSLIQVRYCCIVFGMCRFSPRYSIGVNVSLLSVSNDALIVVSDHYVNVILFQDDRHSATSDYSVLYCIHLDLDYIA